MFEGWSYRWYVSVGLQQSMWIHAPWSPFPEGGGHPLAPIKELHPYNTAQYLDCGPPLGALSNIVGFWWVVVYNT